jgi:hypothetical protein
VDCLEAEQVEAQEHTEIRGYFHLRLEHDRFLADLVRVEFSLSTVLIVVEILDQLLDLYRAHFKVVVFCIFRFDCCLALVKPIHFKET